MTHDENSTFSDSVINSSIQPDAPVVSALDFLGQGSASVQDATPPEAPTPSWAGEAELGLTVSDVAPSNPDVGTQWHNLLTNEVREWTGTEWVVKGELIGAEVYDPLHMLPTSANVETDVALREMASEYSSAAAEQAEEQRAAYEHLAASGMLAPEMVMEMISQGIAAALVKLGHDRVTITSDDLLGLRTNYTVELQGGEGIDGYEVIVIPRPSAESEAIRAAGIGGEA